MPSKNINKKSSPPEQDTIEPSTARRRYDSPVRRQQTAETLERIISAGSELVHQLPAWDWTNITASAVGERAGISERTVHRYFPTERKLRDAVIRRLFEESGVSLETLQLDDFANVTTQMFSYLSSFATEPTTAPVIDPTFAFADQLRCDALKTAVTEVTPEWSDRERENAAAALDILWNLPPYERLRTVWGFDADRSVGAITWLIGLIQEAIQQGRKPN
jgi:AcrR family transcriptional regulator